MLGSPLRVSRWLRLLDDLSQQLQERNPKLRESKSFLVGESMAALHYRWRYAYFSKLQANEPFVLEGELSLCFKDVHYPTGLGMIV